jgi:hypothetical protein
MNSVSRSDRQFDLRHIAKSDEFFWKELLSAEKRSRREKVKEQES